MVSQVLSQPGAEIVHCENHVAMGQVIVDEMGTDETGRPGNKNSFPGCCAIMFDIIVKNISPATQTF